MANEFSDYKIFVDSSRLAVDFRNSLLSGTFGTLLAIFILVIVSCTIVILIAKWRLFEKAKRKGWYSLIPIYNYYVFYDICGLKGWYVFLTLIPIVGQILFVVFYILSSINLCQIFKKGMWFTIGLIFLPLIFLPIIAFDRRKYTKLKK